MENSNQNNKIQKLLQNLEYYKDLNEERSEKLMNVLNALKEKGYEIEADKNQAGNECLQISSKKNGKSAFLLICKRKLGHFLRLWEKNSKYKDLGFYNVCCGYIVDNIINYIEGTKTKQDSYIKEYSIKEIGKLTNELDFYKKMHDNKAKGPEAIESVNKVFQELIDNGYKIQYSEKNDNISGIIISKEDISFSSHVVERDGFQLEIRSNKDNSIKHALGLTSKNFQERKEKFIEKLNEFINKNSKESKVEYQEKKLNNDLDKKFNNTSNNKVSKEELSLFLENEEKVKIKKENKISYAKIHQSFNALAAFLRLNALTGFGLKDEKKHCTGITHNLKRAQNYNPGDVIEINFKFDGVDCMISLELMGKYENNDLPMAMVQYLQKGIEKPSDLRDLIEEFQKYHERNVLDFGYSGVRKIKREQKTIKKEFSEFGESDCEEKQPSKIQCTQEKKGGKEVNLGEQTPTKGIVQEVQFQQK